MKLSDYGRLPLLCPECGSEMDIDVATESSLWHTVCGVASCGCGYKASTSECKNADQALRKLRWVVKKAGDAS